MPEIKIKIGAAVDQSMRTVFKPLVEAAKEARKQVAAEFAAIGRGLGTGVRAGGQTARAELAGVTKASNAAAKSTSQEWARSVKMANAEMRAEWRATEREKARVSREAARARARDEREASQDIIRGFRDEVKAAKQKERDKRQEAERSAAAVNKFAERTSHRATRMFWPNMPIMSMARRGTSEVLQGLGVDTSISGSVSRGNAIESAATALSNQGHIEGDKGANGRIVSPKTLEAEARKLGADQAINPEEILKAQSDFVALTGDLELARAVMRDNVALTASLGGNQREAATAAGEFGAALGDIPDKAARINELMRVLAAQGKKGAIDLKDFAKYAARAASAAPMFEGDKVDNIAKLTALAQIAKQHGGASSPAEAFTAINSMMGTLSKPARLGSMTKLLGNKSGQFTDEGHTKLKDPFELIKSLIVAAKGDIVKINAAVGDSRSGKLMRGLANTFNETTGGKTDPESMNRGLAAMNAELDNFKGVIVSTEEIERANAERKKTREAKAEIFQQKLDLIVNAAADRLVPALERLAPKALELADALGRLVAWAASNPGEAIVTAIGVSIARAGLESVFRAGIENALKGGAGLLTGGAGKGLGGGLGVAGNLSAALAIASISVATFQAGKLVIDEFFGGVEDEHRKSAEANANDAVAVINAGASIRNTGGITPENAEALEWAKASLEKRVEAATTYKKTYKDGEEGARGALIDSALGLGPNLKDPRGAQNDAQHLKELQKEMQDVKQLLGDIKSGELKVRVTNQEQPKAPRAGTTTVDHY